MPRIATREVWLKERKALLAREKELTRQRDEVARLRTELPWVPVEARYVFDGPAGSTDLAGLFDGKKQLILYHFMFGRDWEEPCKSCSFWAESFDGVRAHLLQRDTNLVAASRASLAKIEAFKSRMGWKFPWYSSGRSRFNQDYDVSADADDLAKGATYNYAPRTDSMSELPGLSVFVKDEGSSVYHTYSCYARGLDSLNPTYQLLDLTPMGRHEGGLEWPMAWVDFKDRYAA